MWLVLVLFTALFTSLTDVFSRKIVHRVDVTIIAWAWPFFSLPFLYLSLCFQRPVDIQPVFWLALLSSCIILTIATLFYVKAIKSSDLSLTIPMLTLTPLFMLFTSPLILQESPRPLGKAGIILIVLGSYVMHIRSQQRGFWSPFKNLLTTPGPRYMLVVAFLYSIGGNIDKIGIRNSSPLIWPAALNTALAFSLSLIMLKKTKNIIQQIQTGWIFLVLIGLVIALANICLMYALRLTLVPYIIAVKRTSVIMSSLFGFIIFKEKGMKQRLLGAALMVLGVFIISVL